MNDSLGKRVKVRFRVDVDTIMLCSKRAENVRQAINLLEIRAPKIGHGANSKKYA